MINKIEGKKIKPVDSLKIDENYKSVILDLGCGDGKQTYKMAFDHPENFYVGADANFKGLEEIAKKAKKKPAKGGLNNVIFIHGVAENLPNELESIFDEIQINFPWGSLLEGIITVDTEIIRNIKMVGKNMGKLVITTTYDDKFEENFRLERELPELDFEYLEGEFKDKMLLEGIKITDVHLLNEEEKDRISSPWGKKILSSRDREVFRVEGMIIK